MIYQNEDILKETATIKNSFPSSVLSFSEAALYVCEGIESSYNEMFEQIGIHELAVYESTGNLISYTEADEGKEENTGTALAVPGSENKKFYEKVIEWFKSIWGRIKGFFEGAINKFKTVIEENKKKIVNKFNSADISKLPDKVYGKVSDYSKFNNFMNNGSPMFGEEAVSLLGEISRKINGCKTSNDAQEVYNEYKDSLPNKLIGSSDVEGSGANAIKSFFKSLVGAAQDVKKDFLSSKLNDMVEYVFTDNVVKSLHGMYKSDRKIIDTALSEVKKRANEAKKDDSVVSYAQYEYSLMKNITQLTVTADGCVIDILRKKLSEYRSVLFRVALALGKGAKSTEEKKQTATGESAGLENDLFASRVSMVESAFDW